MKALIKRGTQDNPEFLFALGKDMIEGTDSVYGYTLPDSIQVANVKADILKVYELVEIEIKVKRATIDPELDIDTNIEFKDGKGWDADHNDEPEGSLEKLIEECEREKNPDYVENSSSGLLSRRMHSNLRLLDVRAAIRLATEHKRPLPDAWIEEYNELIKL